MKAHGFRMQWRGKDYSFGLIRGAIAESGRTVLCTSREFINGLMALLMKASITSTRSMVGVFTRGQTVIDSRGIG